MDKFTLSNKRLLDFYQALLSVKHLKGAKFGYAISRTLRSIDAPVKSLQDAAQSPADYLEFRQESENLGKPLACLQGEDLLYDIHEGQLFLQIKPEHQAEFKKKYKALKKKYSSAISAFNNQQTEYNDLLKLEVEIEVYLIPKDLIPEGVTFGQAFRILPMILKEKDPDSCQIAFPNNLLIDFPSKILREFSGVTDHAFILSMLENFRSLDDVFLALSYLPIVVNYNNLYEDGRIKLCEKFATRNCYGNPQMVAANGGIEYLIDDTPLYNKAMKLFKGSMAELVKEYDEFCADSAASQFSKIKFDQLPDDFSGTQIDLLTDLIQE